MNFFSILKKKNFLEKKINIFKPFIFYKNKKHIYVFLKKNKKNLLKKVNKNTINYINIYALKIIFIISNCLYFLK